MRDHWLISSCSWLFPVVTSCQTLGEKNKRAFSNDFVLYFEVLATVPFSRYEKKMYRVVLFFFFPLLIPAMG